MCQRCFDVTALLLLNKILQWFADWHGGTRLFRLFAERLDTMFGGKSAGRIISFSHKAQARSIAFSNSRTFPG